MTNNVNNIPIINKSGFQVVGEELFHTPKSCSVPSMSIWDNSISFSKSAQIALNCCERIRIEVNPQTRHILIIPITEKDKDSIEWMRKDRKPDSHRLFCKLFTEQLFDGWNWKRDYAYRARGKIVSSEKKIMMLFDFSKPENWRSKGKVKDKKNV